MLKLRVLGAILGGYSGVEIEAYVAKSRREAGSGRGVVRLLARDFSLRQFAREQGIKFVVTRYQRPRTPCP